MCVNKYYLAVKVRNANPYITEPH